MTSHLVSSPAGKQPGRMWPPDAALSPLPLHCSRVERDLTRWQPEGPHLDPGLGEGPARFGRPTAGSVTGWDQFEVNRERFQVPRPMPSAMQLYLANAKGRLACSWSRRCSEDAHVVKQAVLSRMAWLCACWPTWRTCMRACEQVSSSAPACQEWIYAC